MLFRSLSIGRNIAPRIAPSGPDALYYPLYCVDAMRCECGAMRCDVLRVSWLMLLLRPVCGSIGALPFLHAMAACTFLVQCGWSGAEPTLMSWTVWLRNNSYSYGIASHRHHLFLMISF